MEDAQALSELGVENDAELAVAYRTEGARAARVMCRGGRCAVGRQREEQAGDGSGEGGPGMAAAAWFVHASAMLPAALCAGDQWEAVHVERFDQGVKEEAA